MQHDLQSSDSWNCLADNRDTQRESRYTITPTTTTAIATTVYLCETIHDSYWSDVFIRNCGAAGAGESPCAVCAVGCSNGFGSGIASAVSAGGFAVCISGTSTVVAATGFFFSQSMQNFRPSETGKPQTSQRLNPATAVRAFSTDRAVGAGAPPVVAGSVDFAVAAAVVVFSGEINA